MQNWSTKRINEIMCHPSELFTGCLSKHALSISCHLNLLSLVTHLMFICLMLFMCTFHQDSTASHFAEELYTFHALRPKLLDIAPFPMLHLLSGIVYLVKLNTFSQSVSHACKAALKIHLFKIYYSYQTLPSSAPVCSVYFC